MSNFQILTLPGTQDFCLSKIFCHIFIFCDIFISLSFFVIAIFFRSLRTLPRQYTPLLKSFSISFGEKKIVKIKHSMSIFYFLGKFKTTVSPNPSSFFSFFPRMKIELIQIPSFTAASTPPLEIPFYGLIIHVLLTRHSAFEFSHVFIS